MSNAPGAYPKYRNAWHNDVTSRLEAIARGLEVNPELARYLPGLLELLRDVLDVTVDVPDVAFHRRMLRVFRDSHYDHSYEGLMSTLQDDERLRLQRFIDGEPLDQAGHRFNSPDQCGTQWSLRLLTSLRAGLVERAPDGLVRVDGVVFASDPKVIEDDCMPGEVDTFDNFVGGLADYIASTRQYAQGDAKDNSRSRCIVIHKDPRFRSWGRLISHAPLYTCIPSTVHDLQDILGYAKQGGIGVRVAAFKLTWTPLSGSTGHVLVSLVGLGELSMLLESYKSHFPAEIPDELECVELVDAPPKRGHDGQKAIRIGVSTSPERLRYFCIDHSLSTPPFEALMTELITGNASSTSTNHRRDRASLLRMVRRVEYLDQNGLRQTCRGRSNLRAAAGSFGSMGIVTHVTLDVSFMRYACFSPHWMPVMRAIPPPPGMTDVEIPPVLRIPGLTAEQRRQDQERFRLACQSDFPAQWFWAPYADRCWTNASTSDADCMVVPSNAPSDAAVFYQLVSKFTADLIQLAPALRALSEASDIPELVTTLISLTIHLALPPARTIRWPVAADNTRTIPRPVPALPAPNLEMVLPLVPTCDDPGVADLTVIQHAWWETICQCYRHRDTCPQLMPLELRFYGRRPRYPPPPAPIPLPLGCVSLDVFTLDSAADRWPDYCNNIITEWRKLDGPGREHMQIKSDQTKFWDGLTLGRRALADTPASETSTTETFAEVRASEPETTEDVSEAVEEMPDDDEGEEDDAVQDVWASDRNHPVYRDEELTHYYFQPWPVEQ